MGNTPRYHTRPVNSPVCSGPETSFLSGVLIMTSPTRLGEKDSKSLSEIPDTGELFPVKGLEGELFRPWFLTYFIWRFSQALGKRVRVFVTVKKSRSGGLQPIAPKKTGVKQVLFKNPTKKGRTKRMKVLRWRITPFSNPYTRTQTNVRRFYTYWKFLQPIGDPYSESSYSSSWTKTRTGSALPKWQHIIRSGGFATTALTAMEDVADERPGFVDVKYEDRINSSSPWVLRQSRHDFTNYYSVVPLAAFASAGNEGEAQAHATRELYRKIYKARHQLQGGVILGEIDKTARMVLGTARKLKQGVFNYLGQAVGIRRGKGSPTSKRKAIANTYLENVFGWQPLLGDMEDLAKTLGRLCHESDRVSFKAIAGSESQVANTHTAAGNSTMFANINRVDTQSVTVIYRGFFRSVPYEVGSPPLERIISMSGFDLRNFIPTMWELVPYSFLVDYFSNIGDCLYALSTDTSIVKHLWRTQIKVSKREYRMVPDLSRTLANNAPNANRRNISVTGAAGLITIERRDVSRQVASVPIMVPRLTGVDLPWKQFANIGALITGKTAR